MSPKLDLYETFYKKLADERTMENQLLMNQAMKERTDEKQQYEAISTGYKAWDGMMYMFDDVAWAIAGETLDPLRDTLAMAFRIATLPVVVVTAVPAVACEIGKITMDTIFE